MGIYTPGHSNCSHHPTILNYRTSCKILNLEAFCSLECTQEYFLAWIVSFARISLVS